MIVDGCVSSRRVEVCTTDRNNNLTYGYVGTTLTSLSIRYVYMRHIKYDMCWSKNRMLQEISLYWLKRVALVHVR